VVCGSCGHKTGKPERLAPQRASPSAQDRTAHDAPCNGLKRNAADLENAVFAAIQARAQSGSGEPIAVNSGRSALAECGRGIARLGDEKRTLYEKLILGELTPDEYSAAKAELDDELVRLTATNAALAAQFTAHLKATKAVEISAAINAERSLTPELADTLIERVEIFPDGEIEIRWKADGFLNGAVAV
jgi:hypothetical protein